MNGNNRRTFTIKEGINLVESVEGLTRKEKADAADLMVVDPEAREAFMSFNDEEVRLLWIKKRLGTA